MMLWIVSITRRCLEPAHAEVAEGGVAHDDKYFQAEVRADQGEEIGHVELRVGIQDIREPGQVIQGDEHENGRVDELTDDTRSIVAQPQPFAAGNLLPEVERPHVVQGTHQKSGQTGDEGAYAQAEDGVVLLSLDITARGEGQPDRKDRHQRDKSDAGEGDQDELPRAFAAVHLLDDVGDKEGERVEENADRGVDDPDAGDLRTQQIGADDGRYEQAEHEIGFLFDGPLSHEADSAGIKAKIQPVSEERTSGPSTGVGSRWHGSSGRPTAARPTEMNPPGGPPSFVSESRFST
jgi:hypothetical protein